MKPLRLAAIAVVIIVSALVLVGVAQPSAPPTPSLSGGQLHAERQRVAAAPDGADGQKEFKSEGCNACHTVGAGKYDGKIGPRLDVTLKGDDAGGILGDITNPQADIAEGYPGDVMPKDYRSRIPAHDLKEIADYLHAAAGAAPKGG